MRNSSRKRATRPGNRGHRLPDDDELILTFVAFFRSPLARPGSLIERLVRLWHPVVGDLVFTGRAHRRVRFYKQPRPHPKGGRVAAYMPGGWRPDLVIRSTPLTFSGNRAITLLNRGTCDGVCLGRNARADDGGRKSQWFVSWSDCEIRGTDELPAGETCLVMSANVDWLTPAGKSRIHDLTIGVFRLLQATPRCYHAFATLGLSRTTQRGIFFDQDYFPVSRQAYLAKCRWNSAGERRQDHVYGAFWANLLGSKQAAKLRPLDRFERDLGRVRDPRTGRPIPGFMERYSNRSVLVVLHAASPEILHEPTLRRRKEFDSAWAPARKWLERRFSKAGLALSGPVRGLLDNAGPRWIRD